MVFDKKAEESLLEHLIEGKSLKSWCESVGIATSTIYRRLRSDPEFLELYKLAKADSADTLADKIVQVCEKLETRKIDPHSARVIIDSYKWIAGKLKPKKWGESIEVNVNNKLTMVEYLLQNQLKNVTGSQLTIDQEQQPLIEASEH